MTMIYFHIEVEMTNAKFKITPLILLPPSSSTVHL